MNATDKLKMKIMTGYCPGCGREIIEKTGKKAKLKSNFRHHVIKLSNWTIMRIGIDDNCKKDLTSGSKVQETADTILESHKIYWRANPKWQPKDFETFTVTDPNTNLTKFKRELSLKKHAEELAKIKK